MSGRLENGSFKILDSVVSMNGFHAFPDKQIAFHEIWRVLKPGGDFIACFYIVCPAKLDHTSRCKSGHGNRQ